MQHCSQLEHGCIIARLYGADPTIIDIILHNTTTQRICLPYFCGPNMSRHNTYNIIQLVLQQQAISLVNGRGWFSTLTQLQNLYRGLPVWSFGNKFKKNVRGQISLGSDYIKSVGGANSLPSFCHVIWDAFLYSSLTAPVIPLDHYFDV